MKSTRAYLIERTAGRPEHGVRLQDQQLEQLILDLGQLGGLVAQDGDLERDHRGQLAEDVVDRDERVVRDGVQREGLPVLDGDRSLRKGNLCCYSSSLT